MSPDQVLERLREVAMAESRAARKNWDRPGCPGGKARWIDGEVRKLVGTGMTQVEAAHHIGVTRSTVSLALKRNGWRL